EAERLGGLEVDHQLELGRLQDWQIGGLGTLQKATRVNSRLTIGVLDAGAVADESAGSDVFAQRVHRRNPEVVGQGDYLLTSAGEQGIGDDDEGIVAPSCQRSERHVDLFLTGRVENVYRLSQGARRLLHFFGVGIQALGIHEHRDLAGLWQQFAE